MFTRVSGGMTDSDHIMAEIAKVLPPEKNGEHLLVDASIDCVGYECCGAGKEVDKRVSEQVLNTCFKVTKAGGGIGVPGIYPVMVRSTLVSARQIYRSTAAAIASRGLIELSLFDVVCLSVCRALIQDPTGANSDNKQGIFHLQYGLSWNKGQTIGQGQCPVMAHNLDLLKAILYDRIDLSQLLNVKIISLAQAEQAYKDFDAGEAAKYIIDPHGMLA